jgi:hypothetical protein
MKKIFITLVAVATIIFLSCTWFRSTKKESSNPLVGQWKVDSIHFSGKDTSFFITKAITNDSAIVDVSFTKDSLLTRSVDRVDTVGYSFDQKLNKLTIKDSLNQTLAFEKVNDSLVSLTTKDSAVVFLQKK